MTPHATNWSGTLTFGARRVHAPTSLAELQEIVAATARIRALGTAHSFSTVADTTADLVSVAGLPATVEVDAAASTVTVSAGIRYGELARRLDGTGFALANLGSLPHIAVGGACATGTHGSGIANGNLASAVRAIELVTANGELRTLSRDADPDRFPGAVIALGALGVVVRLVLDVVPAFELRQVVYQNLPATELVSGALQDVLASAYSVSLFTRWGGPQIDQVWLKHRIGPGARFDSSPVTDDAAPFPSTWRGARLASSPMHPVPGMPTVSCTEQGGVPGPWHERLPHFRLEFTPSSGEEIQTEYLLPREHAADALAALGTIREAIAAALHVSEIRTVAADDLWLSPSYRRDSVAIHFTWRKDPDAVAAVLPAIEDLLAPYEPRPHWGKVFGISPEVVRARYPRADDFRRLASELDPHGKFRNDFVDRYLPPLPLP